MSVSCSRARLVQFYAQALKKLWTLPRCHGRLCATRDRLCSIFASQVAGPTRIRARWRDCGERAKLRLLLGSHRQLVRVFLTYIGVDAVANFHIAAQCIHCRQDCTGKKCTSHRSRSELCPAFHPTASPDLWPRRLRSGCRSCPARLQPHIVVGLNRIPVDSVRAARFGSANAMA